MEIAKKVEMFLHMRTRGLRRLEFYLPLACAVHKFGPEWIAESLRAFFEGSLGRRGTVALLNVSAFCTFRVFKYSKVAAREFQNLVSIKFDVRGNVG